MFPASFRSKPTKKGDWDLGNAASVNFVTVPRLNSLSEALNFVKETTTKLRNSSTIFANHHMLKL
jgi:hypothetical protein